MTFWCAIALLQVVDLVAPTVPRVETIRISSSMRSWFQGNCEGTHQQAVFVLLDKDENPIYVILPEEDPQ